MQSFVVINLTIFIPVLFFDIVICIIHILLLLYLRTGTVYCAAYESGTVPASTNALLASPYTASYKNIADTVYVTIGSLLALHKYAIYCFVKSGTGTSNSLAAVLATKTTVSTACCQSVTFTNAPTSVFGDVTNYAAGSASYVFTYQLGAPPSQNYITVTPIVAYAGTGTAPSIIVTVTPASTTFTSTATSLTGSFYLSYAGFDTALYNVYLAIGGPTQYEFTHNVTTSVSVVGAGKPPAAPKLSVAQFGNTGSFVAFTFDADTNQGGISATTSWACNQLFKFPGAATTQCVWMNNSQVQATFGSISSNTNLSQILQVGNLVTVQPGLIRAVCRSGTACGSYPYLGPVGADGTTAFVDGPNNPLLPNVILIMPTALGPCTNLTADVSTSTGNGGECVFTCH